MRSHPYTEPVPPYRDVKIRPLPPIPIVPASAPVEAPPPTFDASDGPEQEPDEDDLEEYPYLQTSGENENESDSVPTHSTSPTASSLAFTGQPKRREDRQVQWAPDPEPVEPPEKKGLFRFASVRRLKSRKGDRRVPDTELPSSPPTLPPDPRPEQSLWIEDEEERGEPLDMRMPPPGQPGVRESQWERARERARAREADVFRMRVLDFFGFK